MARPITTTPKLNVKATDKFLDQVARDLKRPVGPKATPKINDAIKLIRANACKCKK